MRLVDFLENVGHPIAYYPALAGPLGGVNAAVLFCQLHYWLMRATNDLGVHKTVEDLKRETGLSRAEQETARKTLRARGVLIETHRRIEHKIYYRVDVNVLERLMEQHGAREPEAETRESRSPAVPNAENSPSPKRESSVREGDNSAFANTGTVHSRSGEARVHESANVAFVNGVKTTAEITAESSSNACAREDVDNPANELLPLRDAQTGGTPFKGRRAWGDAGAGPVAESAMIELMREVLQDLARDSGRPCAIDAARDESYLRVWIERPVSPENLREAYRRAVAARVRDGDARPVNIGFLSRFVDEVLTRQSVPTQAAEWWTGGEQLVCAEGARLGVRSKRPDEPLPAYRVWVAKAAGKGPWIEWIVADARRSGSEGFMRFVAETLGISA